MSQQEPTILDPPAAATITNDHPHPRQDPEMAMNVKDQLDAAWKYLSDNILAKFLLSALQSYVSTMRELIENTLKEDPFPVIRHEDVIVVMTAILSCLGLFMVFTCIRAFFRFLCWVLFGSSSEPRNNARVVCEGSNRNNNHGREEFEDAPARKRLPESRRWLRQAKCDLESARNDFDGDRPAPEWVCYKCQQALEKALKAYVMSGRCATTPWNQTICMTHDLCDIAALTNHAELAGIARQLQGICGASPRTRYPDFLPYPQIPRDAYSLEEAITAHRLAGVALDIIDRLLSPTPRRL